MSIPLDIERVALLNWHVYPCSSSSRAGCFEGAHLAATSDLNTIAKWTQEYPRCNWRVIFGKSGLWGLDLDVPSATHRYDGIRALADLVKTHGSIPPRPQARSGGGGLGIFFRHVGERLRGESNQPAPGIDPRRGAQSQTIPPSIHIVTRQPYRWIHGNAPWEITPPIGPQWLAKLLEPPPEPQWRRAPIDTSDQARQRLYRAAMAVMDAPPGARNDTLNRRAYQVGRLIGAGLLAEGEAVDALYGAARSAGLDHAEVRETIRSGIRSGARSHGR